jgi:hypothetical protein
MNEFAVDALARAEVEIEMGFPEVAQTFAIMALAYTNLTDEEQAAVYDLRERLRKNRRRKI